ncbi:MAG: cob(I)yrinic acid a,c-diamide adenosyltransferase [Polyangiaceae bacterium]|nr:cob(I)yrinic acid a,c-diamide adenosyltransferase [Polyangiaceae bacterium]
MRIYTRTGDDGTTGLFGGGRVQKEAARVEAYGSVDETCAAVGVARAAAPPAEVDAVLAAVQADLFVVGAELATSPGNEAKLRLPLIAATDAARLEAEIDAAEGGLQPLTSFVLPGGAPAAAALHHARTVCRRAERRVLALRGLEPVRAELVVYLNRLSDLLFVLARRCNHLAGIADVPWAPRRGGGT